MSMADSSNLLGAKNRPLLKITERHGPCSALWHDGNQAEKRAHDRFYDKILLQDRIRVNSLHYAFSNSWRKAEIESKQTKVPTTSGESYGTGNYVVEVGFGTPTQSMSLIFDTGSDLTWIQCQPCAGSCYNQKDQIFDPSQSKSYSDINCKSSECTQLKSSTGNSPVCGTSSSCIYGIQYGDKSFSQGYFGREKVSLTTYDVFQNFEFGCGQNNNGLFGKAAGLLGLGRGKISFVSQTFYKYNGVFSYCLPSKSSSNGYLSFGNQGSVYPKPIKFTPMMKDSRGPSFYFLNAVAIIVGGRYVPISASVFRNSGMIIDSGTVLTYLPPSAYTAMKSAFQQMMSTYPTAKPLSILDTCYNFDGYDQVSIPKIAFIFQGNVKVETDVDGILVGNGVSQVCLAFVGNDDASDVAIFGNLQQQKLEVVYDIPKGRLGFGPGSCS